MPATHIDFGIVGRTRTGRVDGGSAVAASAYNLCGQLQAEDGRVYDFGRKAGEHVAHEVLLPAGAPPDLRSPGRLWNAAEGMERRSDAQLARQVLVSLPRGCPAELRPDLARSIAADWVAAGMAVQMDLHTVRAADGQEQPHVHFLLSLRRVSDAGLSATKDRTWNTRFRAGDGRAERARIADAGNAFLMAHGITDRIEPRSLAEQGEQRTPEPVASRQAWQRWKRDGADPFEAPAPVVAVLRYREQRAALDAATSVVATSAALAVDIAEQLARLEQSTPQPRPPEPRTATIPARVASQPLPADTIPAAHVQETEKADDRRDIKRATPQPEEATMAHRPTTRPTSYRDRRPATPNVEPWMRQEGGLTALSDALRAAAERSYAEWSKRKPALAQRHDLADYVSFVQDRQAKELERERLATEAPGVPVRPRPEGVGPATSAAAHRAEHLARTLAEEAPPLPSSAWRARAYADEGISRIWPPGLREHIVDRGDRLEPSGPITPALAAATIQIAADRGWNTLTLTGDTAYRDAIAVAAALHRPPVRTDHPLSKTAAEQVAAQLRERAQPAALDTSAVQQLAARDPAAAARQVLDHAESMARAGLAGRPEGNTVPAEIAAPRVADLVARLDQAREDKREAAEALALHHAAYSWGSWLLDPAVRTRHAAMKTESRRLTTASLTMDDGRRTATRKIHLSAEREARANRTALDDWKWSKPVRQAEASLAQLATVRAALDGGSRDALEALARGDLTGAAKAAKAWHAAPAAGAAPADPRTAAVRQLAAAEQQHAADPAGLARARLATAAAVAGDQAVIAAAGAGDPAAIARAAQAWQEEQARRDREQAQERAQQLAAAATRSVQEPAQPSL